jgi:hypothetical protein
MVMTIGELHAGQCINPSLADVVSERNEIRCVERLRTWDWQARWQHNRVKKCFDQAISGLHSAPR